MSGELDIEELKRWDERIREKVDAFGLECYPQEYEVSDHLQMLSYMPTRVCPRTIRIGPTGNPMKN